MKRLSRTSALAGLSNHSLRGTLCNCEDISSVTARNEYWKAMSYVFLTVIISQSSFIFIGIVT